VAKKPEAGGTKRAPAKKITQAEQSKRFIKTAREIGVDETGKEFEAALRTIIPSRKRAAKK
jgi:hypothetical protein